MSFKKKKRCGVNSPKRTKKKKKEAKKKKKRKARKTHASVENHVY